MGTVSTQAYTPGEWRFSHGCVYDEQNRLIAGIPSDYVEIACLVVALPDLLAALKGCLPLLEHVAGGEVEQRALAAVARAEGR